MRAGMTQNNPMGLADDITEEDLEVFLQEADEQLLLLDEDIVRLEHEQNNAPLLQEIFRAAHTLKGSSAMMGLVQMTELAHGMEGLLDRVRQGTLEVTSQAVDALLHSLDRLKTMKDNLANSKVVDVDISGAAAELEAVLGQPSSNLSDHESSLIRDEITLDSASADKLEGILDNGGQAYLVKLSIDRQTSWASVRMFQILQELSNLGEVISSLPNQQDVEEAKTGFDLQVVLVSERDAETLREAAASVDDVVEVVAGPYHPPAQAQAISETGSTLQNRGRQIQTVRIDVELLDRMMNTIGELAIDRARILQIGKLLHTRYKHDELVDSLGQTTSHVVKVVDDLQQEIMKARLLPVGTVFNGFSRMVRDLAQKFGKKVDFVIEGQDTEVDRTMIERIRDPLLHLLRNAIDHGIETPEVRAALGKPETATIRLVARHEQSQIVISVEDDGGGINPDLVRAAALKKGLVSAEALARLSDAQIIDLIFLPGASTAEKTTDVSGRGVGMDIVKTNVEAVNGVLTVDNRVGEGCKFSIRLPLTLATLQTLLLSLQDTTYAVPLIHVVEALKAEPQDIYTIGGEEVIRMRDTVVPLLRLGTALNRDHSEVNKDEDTYVVVVRLGDHMIGLAVDSFIALQEITIKSMGGYLGQVQGLAGASILGDGQVVLVLDVPSLIHSWMIGGSKKAALSASQ